MLQISSKSAITIYNTVKVLLPLAVHNCTKMLCRMVSTDNEAIQN